MLTLSFRAGEMPRRNRVSMPRQQDSRLLFAETSAACAGRAAWTRTDVDDRQLQSTVVAEQPIESLQARRPTTVLLAEVKKETRCGTEARTDVAGGLPLGGARHATATRTSAIGCGSFVDGTVVRAGSQLGSNSLMFSRMPEKDAAMLRRKQRVFPDIRAAMIEFDRVVRRYGRTLAVNGLSLTIPQASFCAARVPTAPARPPTIRMLVGLLQPDSGQVRVCGIDCSRNPRGQQSCWAMCPTNNTSTKSFPAGSSWNSPAKCTA